MLGITWCILQLLRPICTFTSDNLLISYLLLAGHRRNRLFS
uniref:Uncharacterized protein n=1 Tax=Rhizophora mucronata TaxID=61149 RepID=A0A2P2QHJ3_RHIMU